MKQILLARPSGLMISDMTKLISEAKYEPIRLVNSQSVTERITENVVAIVISTAISSNVKESYSELIKKLLREEIQIPIFISSFTNIKRTRIVVNAKLSEAGMELNLLSMEETNAIEEIDFSMNLIVITKSEMSEVESYNSTLNSFKRIIQKNQTIKI